MILESWVGIGLLTLGIALVFVVFLMRRRRSNVLANRGGVVVQGDVSGLINTGDINSTRDAASSTLSWVTLLGIAASVATIIGLYLTIWPLHK